MKKKQVEIPAWYGCNLQPGKSGVEFIREYSSVIPGAADRYLYARNIVDNNEGEALIQFIAEILLAYDCLRLNRALLGWDEKELAKAGKMKDI